MDNPTPSRTGILWSICKRLLHAAATFAFTAGCVAIVFLLLPILQRVSSTLSKERNLVRDTTSVVQAPPPMDEQAPEEKPPEEEEEAPRMQEIAEPLGLDALDAALNPGGAGGMGTGPGIQLGNLLRAGGEEESGAFDLSDLDQKPRVVFQPAPEYPPALKRQKLQGTVFVIFEVDTNGRVQRATVQKSSHPAFEAPALTAVGKWRFEPGKRKGESVAFKMRVPITFIPK